MIVAHLGTGGDGGAGGAMRKIHRAVRAAGVDSRLFLCHVSAAAAEDGAEALRRPAPAPWSPRSLGYRLALKLYTTGRPSEAGLFSYTTLPFDTPFPFDRVTPDVVHLHWVAQGFDYGTLFPSLPPSTPVVWTLHDMEPMTGGCHQAGGCARYRSGCGRCPQLNALRNPWDLSALTFRRKRRWFARPRLHAVAVSRSIAADAGSSPLFADAHGVSVIPNIIDTARFTQRLRSRARARFSLPADRCVVAFGAVEPGNPYKGLPVLVDAMSRLPPPLRPQLLVFGGAVPPGVRLDGLDWRHAGFLGDPDSLAELYSAADVVAVPSLAESFGQVAAEALACGTPVLASRVGGLPDFVIEGITGRLAAPGDAGDLAANLAWLVEHPEQRRELGAAGAHLVRQRFSAEAVAAQYGRLYAQLARGPDDQVSEVARRG